MSVIISLSFLFQLLLIIVNISFLVIASIEDWKYREIQDRIWLYMLLFSLPLVAIKIVLDKPTIIFYVYYGLNVFFGIMFGLVMFYTGAWGGADSKAIIVLSITYPFLQIINPPSNCFMPAILGISINFLIFFLSLVIAFAVYNVLFFVRHKELFQGVDGSIIKKIGVFISGYKEKIDLLKQKKFFDIAEEYDGNKWILSSAFSKVLDEEEEKEYIEKEKELISLLEKSGKKYVWIKPQPPGILFVLLAFLSYILFGSPVLEKLLC